MYQWRGVWLGCMLWLGGGCLCLLAPFLGWSFIQRRVVDQRLKTRTSEPRKAIWFGQTIWGVFWRLDWGSFATLFACLLVFYYQMMSYLLLRFSHFILFSLHIGRNKEVFLSGKTLVFVSWFHVMDITTFDLTTSPSSSTVYSVKPRPSPTRFNPNHLFRTPLTEHPNSISFTNLIPAFVCLSTNSKKRVTKRIWYHITPHISPHSPEGIYPPRSHQANNQTNKSITTANPFKQDN